MIQKVSFLGFDESQNSQIQSFKENKVSFVQKVKDGDEKTLKSLAFLGTIALASAFCAINSYKSRPSVILKEFDSAISTVKQSGLETLNDALIGFGKKSTSSKTEPSSVFEVIQTSIQSGRLQDVDLGHHRKIHVASVEDGTKIIAELMDGDSLVARIISDYPTKRGDLFAKGAQVVMETEGTKIDRLIATFSKDFTGKIQGQQKYTDFLKQLIVEQGHCPEIATTKAKYIFTNEISTSGDLKIKSVMKKVFSLDDITTAKASIEYSKNGRHAMVKKGVDITKDGLGCVSKKVANFTKDKSGNWERYTSSN